MAATRANDRSIREPEHGGGPPQSPRFIIERDLIECRADGSLWSRPYCRRRTGNPLLEMLSGEWERHEETP